MLIDMTGEQLALDEDHFFDEFEVWLCDDHLENDQIKILAVMENDCDVSHLVDEGLAEVGIRSVLELKRIETQVARQAIKRGMDI